MRCTVPVENQRRILCVFPHYTPSFGTFSHSYALMPGVGAFMPPQGLLVIAAFMPEGWDVRVVDENIAPATDADYAWADAVFVSGMHIQAPQIRAIHARARAFGKVSALGGSSASASPEAYPEFDYLHVGELGDATDRLVAMLDESVAPPPRQVVLETVERLALDQFPTPAYDAVPIKTYLLGSIQFSSGCPYRCEFCDIPALYGRQPRLKTPEQLLLELDTFIAQPLHSPVIYFVDDNFIANRRATKEMLPHLIAWQKERGYPLRFTCEATLNLAKQPDIMAMMREAGFFTIFVGIETPDLVALTSIDKKHNAAVPMMEGIETLNSYGFEVVSGIILGLDTDSDESEARLIEFIERSHIPLLTMNLLQALPKTPLWNRLSRENRLTDDPRLESNVKFLRPHDAVVETWRRVIAHAYAPENLFPRFVHQLDATYRHRFPMPPKGQLTASNLRRGLYMGRNILWRVGVKSDYRRHFWRAAWQALKRGQIEAVYHMGFVGYHLIRFTREAVRGEHSASFYDAKAREAERLSA